VFALRAAALNGQPHGFFQLISFALEQFPKSCIPQQPSGAPGSAPRFLRR
jgi:hypothetical protein